MEKAIEFIKDYCPQPGVFIPQGTKAVADCWFLEELALVTTSIPVTENGDKELDISYKNMLEYTREI